MQEAIPYKTWAPLPDGPSLSRSSLMNHGGTNSETNVIRVRAKGHVKNLVSENAVMVFGRRGCCMSHVVKRLLQGLGVNPVFYEVDEGDESSVVGELETIDACEDTDRRLQFPAVFIGGHLFGGLDKIMAAHITGELIPVLKEARALWL
ncbi:hypothetical protein RJ639_024376 [Escallonia herrerae]|uniref:Glutaredoxin domain-containing protein n=1 Tax=Escallonia herrerae TaxID=1293975 RepID=A0AA88UZX9_9ASTE|nr:hypothetical protein RJ639_024992 [Escallonia herrerae]KAK2998688.1 hypothetical protein RJ639_024376 [Escallonia herrerae]